MPDPAATLAYESDLKASDHIILPYRPLAPRVVSMTLLFMISGGAAFGSIQIVFHELLQGRLLPFIGAIAGIALLSILAFAAACKLYYLARTGRRPIIIAIVKDHLVLADPDVFPAHRPSIPINEVDGINVSHQRREKLFWRYEFIIAVEMTNKLKRHLDIQTYDPAARQNAIDQIRQKLPEIPLANPGPPPLPTFSFPADQ